MAARHGPHAGSFPTSLAVYLAVAEAVSVSNPSKSKMRAPLHGH